MGLFKKTNLEFGNKYLNVIFNLLETIEENMVSFFQKNSNDDNLVLINEINEFNNSIFETSVKLNNLLEHLINKNKKYESLSIIPTNLSNLKINYNSKFKNDYSNILASKLKIIEKIKIQLISFGIYLIIDDFKLNNQKENIKLNKYDINKINNLLTNISLSLNILNEYSTNNNFINLAMKFTTLKVSSNFNINNFKLIFEDLVCELNEKLKK